MPDDKEVQLCARCEEPTDRCVEDTLWSRCGEESLCEDCFDEEREENNDENSTS